MQGRTSYQSSKRLINVLSSLLLVIPLATTSTAQSRPAPQVISLKDALAQAIQHSPQIKEEQFGILLRQSQRAQADAARFAQLDITIVGGPSPRARGNQIDSPDSKNHPTINGAFGQATFSVVQPLYTFGKIQSFRKAASHGVAVSEAKVRQKATEVALLVYEAYYGYQLATALEDLGQYIGEQLENTLKKIQRQLDAEAPGVDTIDLFKLQTMDAELTKRMNDVRQGKALAISGLSTLMGLAPDTPLQLTDTQLRPVKRDVGLLEQYMRDARQLRPEFTQAREGVQAFEALVKAAKADYYPVLFLGVFGSLAKASNRNHLSNPFIYDPLNDDVVAPVVGLRWHYDLGLTTGKVHEAEARLGQVQQQHALAEMGIPFQVRQAHLELIQHRDNIATTRRGFQSGRQWLVAALSNFDLGVGEGKDVADAALAYVTLRAEYFQAVYNYNLALVKLDHAAGRDVATVVPLLPNAVR